MLISLLLSRNMSSVVSFIVVLPILLFSLCFHEFSHALVAYWLGDPTARNYGRLTLNPAKHLDLFGTLSMLLIGFGWAKPVPINTRFFKKPRLGMALTSLAGPVSNLILCLFSTLFMQIAASVYLKTHANLTDLETTFSSILLTVFMWAAIINAALAVFNFIPVPPFDGSRVLTVFLPDRAYFGLMKYERYYMFIVIGIFMVLSWFDLNPVSWIANEVVYLFELLWSLIPSLPYVKFGT